MVLQDVFFVLLTVTTLNGSKVWLHPGLKAMEMNECSWPGQTTLSICTERHPLIPFGLSPSWKSSLQLLTFKDVPLLQFFSGWPLAQSSAEKARDQFLDHMTSSNIQRVQPLLCLIRLKLKRQHCSHTSGGFLLLLSLTYTGSFFYG